MLRYQKAMGTTLRPARSLRSHCTRNRMENRSCPNKPTESQRYLAIMPSPHGHGADRAVLEPQHTRQIHEADPEPVEYPIMRAPVTAHTVMDGSRGDPPPAPKKQRRQEAMHVVEVRQLEERGAVEELEAASRIGSRIAEPAPSDAVRDSRWQPLD